jgi:hypothetical protein
MYRLCHNLGFDGKYIIFDFPMFSALQQYYIKSIGLELHNVDSFESAKHGVICVSDIQILQDLLLTNISSRDKNMFIATWSLSESPVDLRYKILSLIAEFKAFLFAFQGKFEEVDNVEFFNNWMKKQVEKSWFKSTIEHIPNEFYRNNYYLIGSSNA